MEHQYQDVLLGLLSGCFLGQPSIRRFAVDDANNVTSFKPTLYVLQGIESFVLLEAL